MLDGGDLSLLSRVDKHQGIRATIVKITVQPRQEKVLQVISALEDDE